MKKLHYGVSEMRGMEPWKTETQRACGSLRGRLSMPGHCQVQRAKPVWDLEGLPATHKQDRLCFLEWERWVSVKQIPKELPTRDSGSQAAA